MAIDQNQISTLLKHKAYLIPLGADKEEEERNPLKRKRPFKGFEWRDKGWDGKPVEKEMPPRLGVKPASLGLVVIDIDIKDITEDIDKIAKERAQLIRDVLGPPLVNTKTDSGGLHLYYKVKDAAKIKDTKLYFKGKCIGDFKAGSGYVVLWNNTAEMIIENILKADKGFVDSSTFEKDNFLEELKQFFEKEGYVSTSTSTSTKLVDKEGKIIWDGKSIDPPGETIINLNNRVFQIQLRNPNPKEEIEKAVKIAEKTKIEKTKIAQKKRRGYESENQWKAEIKSTVKSAIKAANKKKIEQSDKDFVHSQDDLADKFVKEYAEDFMCVLDSKDKPTWWRWDGKMWVPVKNSIVVNAMIKFAKKNWKTPGKETQTKQDMLVAGGRPNALATVQILMANEKILVDESNLNQNENLFAMSNGDVLDLMTFKVRPQKREDKITIASGSAATYSVRYNPKIDNKKYTWQKWTENQLPNEHQREYVQRFAGYTLFGHNKLQKALALIGKTSCGKSTFLRRLTEFHRDYSFPIATHVLVKEENARYKGGSEDYYKHMMKNIRLAPVVEWDDGDMLNADLFCSLSGGDVIAARGCGKDPSKFVPTFKMVLVANNAPLNLTRPVLRRLAIIHMEQSFEGKEDPEWENYFNSEEGRAEYQEWILEGAKAVAEDGLNDHPKYPNLKINLDIRAINLRKKLEQLVEAGVLCKGDKERIQKDKLARIVFRVSPPEMKVIKVAKRLSDVREVVEASLPLVTVNGYELYVGYSTGVNYEVDMEHKNLFCFNQ